MTRSAKRRAPTPSDDVLLAEIAVRHTFAKGVRALITLGGLALVVLATWPAAHELSGNETVVNISLAFGLTASLTLAGAGVTAWGESQRRRANRVTARNAQLSRDVKELQQRLRDNGLPDDVSR